MASHAVALILSIAIVAVVASTQIGETFVVFETAPGSSIDIPCGSIRRGNVGNWHWKRNGREIEPTPPKCRGDDSTRVCVAKNGDLSIRDTRPYDDSGYYRCFASVANREPVKSKTIVKLEIRAKADPPFILGGDELINVAEESRVTIPCIAIGGSSAKVTWSRGNSVTRENALEIARVGPKTAGTYRCTIANPYGSDVRTVTINSGDLIRKRRHSSNPIPDPATNPPFAVIVEPQDTTVTVGEDARFDCQFKGDPGAAVLWYKNRTKTEGTLVAPRNYPSPKYVLLTNNSLVVKNATHADADFYTCQVIQSSGEREEHRATLFVEDETIEVPTPTPPPVKDATPTPIRQTAKPPGPTVAITGEPDGKVENIRVTDIGTDSARVTWTYVDSGNHARRPTAYYIYYTSKETARAESKDATPEFTLAELKPYTSYTVKVAPKNSEGKGTDSESVTIRTNEGVPGPPRDITITTRGGEGTITIAWEAPDEPNGVITAYKVIYQAGDTVVEKSYSPSTRRVTIDNLSIDTKYAVSVVAVTSAGEGTQTESQTVTAGTESATPFTQTVYFYIIIALAAVVALALLILVIVCVRRSRTTGDMDATKSPSRRHRPAPALSQPERSSYTVEDVVAVPPLYPNDSSARFFPPPPSRRAPQPAPSSAAPSVQTTLSPRHAAATFESPRYSPSGSVDQIKYVYAAEGPDLELERMGKRARHGSKQAYGLTSYGTTGDIDSMKDRFSVEYSPGTKSRTGSIRVGEPVLGGPNLPVYRPKMMPSSGHTKQSDL